MDYIFRWLELRFLTGQQQSLFDNMRPKFPGDPVQPPKALNEAPYAGDATNASISNGYDYPGGAATRHQHASDAMKDLIDMGDAPSCHICGAIMTRNGSCYRCMSCGSTSGCS